MSKGWLQRVVALTSACGTLPVLAAGVLVLTPMVRPPETPPLPPPTPARPVDPDLEIIDAVLSKRAPDLGGTLREQLDLAIAQEARRAGFDPLLILAIIDVESDFEDDAVSHKGARGLMQIKPSTLAFLAEKEGIRLSPEEISRDPALRVRLGIRYLKRLHDQFRDLDLALMAYNAGPARIRQARKEDELDTFRRYANLVRRDYLRFRKGLGLDGDWAVAVRLNVDPVTGVDVATRR